MVKENLYFVKRQQQTIKSSTWCNEVILGIRISLHFLSEMINNNMNLSICRVKVNCQIRKFKITKLKQQVVPTYSHTDSTDVIENDYNNNHPNNQSENLFRYDHPDSLVLSLYTCKLFTFYQ
jgi:translation elongation factor EF-Ts